jgi:hypothetical protein
VAVPQAAGNPVPPASSEDPVAVRKSSTNATLVLGISILLVIAALLAWAALTVKK